MFDASEDATIAWPAFPKILSEDSMLTWRQAMATADKRPAPGESRIHDEYLEWFVEYDEESNLSGSTCLSRTQVVGLHLTTAIH